MRLNDCDLFNPDSPRYVIYSQSLVNLGDYRATDLPGSPLYSWRPPGLSLLLVPMMAIRPYDVVAAKCVILLCGALLLWFLYQFNALHCERGPALLMTGVVATSPAFLVLSTEVLSEIPYTLGVLIVLFLLSRPKVSDFKRPMTQSPRSQFLILGVATFVLTFTTWLRTAGVSLVIAVALWSLASRSRRKWLVSVICAAAGLAVLALRNRMAAGENYAGSLFTRLREQGFLSTAASGIDTIQHYLSTAPGLLLPGLTSQRPMYAPLTLDGLPNLGVPYAVQASIAAIIGIVAILGMWKQRSVGSSLSFLYFAVYCACLVVWPWRHERFLWPLIPVILAYVPAGTSLLLSGLRTSNRDIYVCGTISLLALAAWQSTIDAQIVQVNLEFIRDRVTFHATRCPSFYFSNWRQAGSWLRNNAPPSSRVLTWHAAVAGTSRLFQRRVQFETYSPDKLRQQIEQFSARYLVVPDAQFGDGFGWQQLAADPALTMNVVYREQDVAVLEVVPNRTGAVSLTAYPEWLVKQSQLIADARQKMPERIDLAIRHASLLRESGDDKEAITILRGLFEKGVITARICAELGWMLYDAGDFAESARLLDMAKSLPNAESIAGVLAEGAAKARQRLAQADSAPTTPPVERQLRRVKALMNSLKFAAAQREAAQMIDEHPEHAEVNFVRGTLYHQLGELQHAEACYEKALQLGFKDAEEWLFVIRFDEALARPEKSIIEAGSLQQTIDPANANDHVQLSKLLREHGWPGRALAILEQANARFADQIVIQQPLADLYRHFARPDLARPLYQAILQHKAEDDEARKGLIVAERLLIEPEMNGRRASGER